MTTYHDAVNDALERLSDLGYERNLGGGDLANHGPMGAETLATLGHTDQIPAWIRTYRQAAPHHEPPVAGQELNSKEESSWRAAMGDISRAGDFEKLFTRELAEQPWQQVLARWWPRLLPGPLTGLTHGLIRTAHAVRSLAAATPPTDLQLNELTRALGYWAARFIDAPGRGQLTGTMNLPQAIAAIRRSPDKLHSPQEGMHRMRNPQTVPGYFDALDALAPDHAQRLLSHMTAEFAGICVAHSPQEFAIPLLHGVTAPAAARLVLPHLPEHLHEATVAALWQAQVTLLLVATTNTTGENNALHEATKAQPPTWDTLVARAVEHQDEHVIKFTEASLREHTLQPDPRYAWAVDIAQQHIERPNSAGGSAIQKRFGNRP